ncbi:hypothetical protein CBS101457_004812 [Exobasidium rhododendri]|nr:hypothetical protein CBS101457_004812 [Exobasidium rhododendri]
MAKYPSSASNNESLFNSDEVRFMQDSLSSAESFDPFTIGTPGFKVPNVLPANLGGMVSVPRGGSNGFASGSTTNKDSMSSGEQSTFAQHQGLPQQTPLQMHASQGNPIRGGYGRDKAWQMQQLESLQMERQKFLSHQRQTPLSVEGERSSSSMPDFAQAERVGRSLDGADQEMAWMHYGQPPQPLQPNADYLYSSQQQQHQQHQHQHLHQQQQHQHQHQQHAHPPSTHMLHPNPIHSFAESLREPTNGSMPLMSNAESSQDLSHLALRFPSSHQFPAAPREEASSSKRQRKVNSAEGVAMSVEGEQSDVSRRGGSPGTRPSWTTDNADAANQGVVSLTEVTPLSAGGQSLQQEGGVVKCKSGFSNNISQVQAQQHPQPPKGAMTFDLDAPYTFLPAPRPPPELIDISKAETYNNAIPSHLRKDFFSSELKRFQPHLSLLRQEQMKRKEAGLSANIRKGDKKVNTTANIKNEGGGGSPIDGVDDGEADKKKASHVLLTEAEKKANHIASEQKRRANIRKGYELLCDLIPSLREDGEEAVSEDTMGIDGDDEGGGGGGGGGLEEEDDSQKGKRRRDCEAGVAGGEKMEGKAGPRSEAAILMAAVEHLRAQLEGHRDLVIRKQEAQLRVAQKFNIDISR